MSEQHESDDHFDHDVTSETPVESREESHSDQGDGDRNRSAEVLDLISGVEKQLEQMRNAQSACVEEIATLAERRDSILAREREIAEIGSALDERQSCLEAQANDLGNREEELSAAREENATRSSDIAGREQELEQRSSALDAQNAEIETAREVMEESRTELEAAQASLENERESLEQDRERITNESEQAAERAEAAESKCHELETEHGALSKELKKVFASLEKAEARASSAEESVETIQAESLELSSKLEEAAAVIENRDLQIEEAGAEAAATKSAHAEMEQTITRRESELNELQDSFDVATERLQALASAVAEQAPRLEEGAAAAALCQEQEERIQSMGKDLEDAREQVTRLQKIGDGDDALAAAREELERVRTEMEDSIPVDEHERVVSSLQSQLSASVDGSHGGDGAIHEELAKARAELKSLKANAAGCESSMRSSEERLATLQERNEQLESMCDENLADMPEDAIRLREQAQRLSSFATHLQRRRGRLRDIRSILRQRRNNGSGAFEAIDGDRKYKSNQEDLLRRSHELNDLESKMLRRWAHHGMVSTVLRVTFLIAIVASVSWFSVRLISPGLVSASALIRAQPIAGGLMDDARATSWNEWHDSILKDKLFAGAVVSRLAASPAGFSEDGDVFYKSLSENLEVETVQPGTLQLRLYGNGRADTARRLEGVVATLSSESQRQLSRRGDGARVEALARNGQIVTLDPVPVSTRQIQNAGIVFGGSLLGIGLFGAAIYSRLSRSRRIFDENVGFDEDELD